MSGGNEPTTQLLLDVNIKLLYVLLDIRAYPC